MEEGAYCEKPSYINRHCKHLEENHEDMSNNRHTLSKKKKKIPNKTQNPFNTGQHFVPGDEKQYVSYTTDLIQALDPKAHDFFF